MYNIIKLSTFNHYGIDIRRLKSTLAAQNAEKEWKKQAKFNS